MSSIGPTLLSPPNPAKRKRSNAGDYPDESSDSSSDFGPTLPHDDDISKKKPRVIGPSLPSTVEQQNNEKNGRSDASAASRGAAHDRNASMDDDEDDDDDDDDDGFEPSLPPAQPSSTKTIEAPSPNTHNIPDMGSAQPSKRDDWMMVPPTGGDWSARIDPTKLKNRKFNTGKGAKAPSTPGNAANTWHETPAEKQARLQREMMGVKDSSTKPGAVNPDTNEKYDAETAKRLAEYNKSRGPSLYDSHQTTQTEKDDDPSAREFDREKDIGGGLQINATRRKEMLKTASNLGSRFGSAKYL